MRGRTALVTGATSGIGRAIALRLTAEGARVCLVGRDPERLREVAAAAGDGALPLAADLGRDADVRTLAGRAVAGLGRLDVLVHAAGRHVMGTVEGAPVSALDDQLALNLRAPYVLTQAVLPELVAAQGD